MEVEDPIAAKFQALIESLMVKTTSDIVKAFTEVLLETRVEISCRLREIDELKQQLQESQEQRTHAVLRNQATFSFKKEDGEMSCVTPQVSVSDTSTVNPENSGRKIPENATAEKTDNRQSCVAVRSPTTPQISPGTSGINLSVNWPNQNKNGQLTQTAVRLKRGHSTKSSAVTRPQTSVTKVAPKSPLQTMAVVMPPQTSSSKAITLLGKKSERKKGVAKKKCIQKKTAPTCSIASTHKLRDRKLIGTQRRCLCCSSDQCSMNKKHPKTNDQKDRHIYTCKQCRKWFFDWMQFKHHTCTYECSRCGQTFTSLKNITTHRRRVNPSTSPYPHCCGHTITTQCDWNMHKRFHAHSDHTQNAKVTQKPSQILTAGKELSANVAVRLERISDAQMEAALSPRGSSVQEETSSPSSLDISQSLPSGVETPVFKDGANAPSTCTHVNTPVLTEESSTQSMTKIEECLPSTSTNGMDQNLKQPDIQSSAQIQPVENKTESDSLTIQKMARAKCEKRPSSKKPNSLLRKQKISDCHHGVLNDVFPVEKILRWRNIKGKNEVRVKWVPCSLCGAKWKDTWEPAESFVSYKDSKNEEPQNSNK